MSDSEPGINCRRCGDFVCPECGVLPSPASPPPAPQIQTRPKTKARRAGALIGALVVLTATMLVGAPLSGVVVKIVWRLAAWGWGLVP